MINHLRGIVPPIEAPEDDEEAYKIVNLLNNPTLIPIFQIKKKQTLSKKSQKILSSLGKHIEEIICYIFEDTPSPLGTRCYLALQSSQENLMKSLIEEGLLQAPAHRLMSVGDPSKLSVCRLAGVTLATIMCRPSAISQSCGYLFQLLEFIDQFSIYDFFYQLCGSNPIFEEAQKWLITVNFDSVITNQIKITPIDDPRLKYYFKLCGVTRNSKILQPKFTSSKVVSILCGKFTTLYEGERWEALLSLYCEETRVYMQSLFPVIVQKLKEPFTVCTRYHVAMLGVLTKIIIHDQGLHPFIAMANLAPEVMRLFVTFPEHSILMGMIDRFSRACFDVPEIAAQFAPVMLPTCMEAARSRKSVTLAAQAMKIINMAKLKCFNDPLLKNLLLYIPGFKQFVRKELAEYLELERQEYGGESVGLEAKPKSVNDKKKKTKKKNDGSKKKADGKNQASKDKTKPQTNQIHDSDNKPSIAKSKEKDSNQELNQEQISKLEALTETASGSENESESETSDSIGGDDDEIEEEEEDENEDDEYPYMSANMIENQQ
ncbi:hypothetical protein TRFO_06442 [Tritrichomonas foetus]|uniref:Uncharacterized protein n=1 Tax=Tritrichomonas foetus TaxID=1144522 RepID=A0A1J4K3S4_9EUKA|nr:hypothetical protein TRFO_06442 [Tritrichomonas foetus]|eukprot:OHT04133.1 hypothetical protein TRFO_06442 [Tritrichomonas foetus]